MQINVLRGDATRTRSHPDVLLGYERLLSLDMAGHFSGVIVSISMGYPLLRVLSGKKGLMLCLSIQTLENALKLS